MIIVKPPSWTLEEWVEAQVKIKQLSIRKTFHWKAYDYCSARDKYLNLPVIVLTSLVSTTAISQTASSENSDTMNYVISGTSLLVTALTSLSKYFNYSESKEAHRQAALNYLRLRSELAELLSTAHIKNEDTKPITFAEFTKMYYNKFISVRENAPTLPGSIRKAMDLTNKEKCKELKEKIRTRNAENTKIDFSEIVEEEEIATLQINQAGGRTMNSTDI
jgi:thiamine biosynthesis lipoprotein ApbE